MRSEKECRSWWRQLLKEAGTSSSVVYGAMDQEARSIHLDNFRKGKVRLLTSFVQSPRLPRKPVLFSAHSCAAALWLSSRHYHFRSRLKLPVRASW